MRRFEKRVYVGLPDKATRKNLIKKMLKNNKVSKRAKIKSKMKTKSENN